jgi:hypothetical protein
MRTKHQIDRPIKRRHNVNRASIVKITVYLLGSQPLGEPTRERIESMPSKTKFIRTYRKDHAEFNFVECRTGTMEEKTILVVGFDKSGINRNHCKSIKNWDKKVTFP